MNRIKYYKKVKIVNRYTYVNYFDCEPIETFYISINEYFKNKNEFVKVYDLINNGMIQYEKFVDLNDFKDKDSHYILKFSHNYQVIQYKHLVKLSHNHNK